ncbi:hypothetical protein LTR95_014915 [Oleoguttula sp. CCFEE 5521]
MAKSKAKAWSIAVHGTTFTKRDVELIIAAIGSTKSGLNPNIELFASLGQFESPAVAQQAWDTVRRKYGVVIDALTGEEEEEEDEEEGEGEAEEEEAVAIKPLPKSAARSKPLKPAFKPTPPIAEEGESERRRSKRGAAAEADHEASPARKPAKAPVREGRANKPAKRIVYAGADESEPETVHPAVIVDKRAGADAVAAMEEDDDDDDDEEEEAVEQVTEQPPSRKRGRPAKKAKGKAKKAKKTADVEAEDSNALSAYESALFGMKGGKSA